MEIYFVSMARHVATLQAFLWTCSPCTYSYYNFSICETATFQNYFSECLQNSFWECYPWFFLGLFPLKILSFIILFDHTFSIFCFVLFFFFFFFSVLGERPFQAFRRVCWTCTFLLSGELSLCLVMKYQTGCGCSFPLAIFLVTFCLSVSAESETASCSGSSHSSTGTNLEHPSPRGP